MEQFRFGKHPAKADYRTLRLGAYLTAALDPPPAEYDVLSRVFERLGATEADLATLFPLDGNDNYGDCTMAALAHAVTVYNGYLGRKFVLDEALILKLYFQLTKGVDSGLVELDVLNYWQSTGVAGEKIAAFVKIGTTNFDHIKQAITLFGGVYLGFQVQQNCLSDFKNGVPWTPGALTNDGHAVYATAYDEQGVTVLTWGSKQKATWAWWQECVDEVYAILPSEALQSGWLPGFDSDTLRRDLQAVAN